MPTGGRWYRWRSRGEAVTVEGASSKPVLRDEKGRLRPGSAPPPRRNVGARVGNLNASRYPWRAFWRRRALRPEDRWILPVLADYAGSLVADRGGPEAICAGTTAGVYPRLTMALIKCAECGKEMSSEAPACPSCGKPNAATVAKKKTSTRDAGCLLMVLGLLGSFFVPGSLQVFMWGLLFVGLVVAVLGMVKK